MIALITEDLIPVAGAPDGIASLRKLVKQLATRGALVPQHAQEGTATGSYASAAGPFLLPSTWRWVTLGAALEMVNGRAFKPSEWKKSGLPIVRIQNLNRESAEYNFASVDDIQPRHIIDTGAFLISWSGTPGTSFGAFIWNRGKAALNQHIFSCRQREPVFVDRFLQLAINTRLDELIAKAHGGVGLQHVTKGKLEALALALPPLAEQHRIVAKVDELMALCDRLEARQLDAEAAHTQLVQVLLDRLTHARDAEEFQACWERVAGQFEVLFTTEGSVETLKGFIMQAAVEGRLVGDAPRSEWRTATIETFCTVQGGIQKTPLRAPARCHYPYLRVANVQRGRVDVTELERYELAPEELERWRLHAGDLLIVEGNGSANEIGRCAIWRGEVDDCVYQNHLMRVRPTAGDDVEYLELYLNSPVGTAHMRRLAITTSGLFNLSVGKIRSIPVELPPQSMQLIIVAKVRQLMSMCDDLSECISAGRAKHAQLAEAVVVGALAA